MRDLVVCFDGARSKEKTGTTDVALGWMMDEAAALGLRFEPGAREAVRGDPFAKLGNEEGWMWERAPRAVPEIQDGNGNLHPSVLARRKKLKDPWTPHQETSGWVETAEGRCSVCTGMWLEAGQEAADTEQARLGRNMVPFHGKLAETWFHSMEKWARHGSIPWKSPGRVAGSLRVAPHRLFLVRGGGGRGGRAGR